MERLHTPKEIHEKTGLPMASLYEWVKQTAATHRQVGPIFRKIGRLTFYRLKDVKDYIERNEIVSNRSRKYAG